MTSATAAAQPAAPWSAGLPRPAGPSHPIAAPDPALQALVVLARLHHVSADAELLAHQLGLPGGRASNASDLLQAAHLLGLKAKLSRTSALRLPLAPLPALALMNDGRAVVLAQCDSTRVLVQRAGAAC